MRRILAVLFLGLNMIMLSAQDIYRKEGEVINNTVSGSWEGVNIPRAVRTSVSFLNNSVTSVNSSGYLLQAGDEGPMSTNNNLDGAVITGNRLCWNGSDASSITHGMFMGYNINYTVKYNYLDKTPYGILFKSGTDEGSNMTYSSGYGAAYNIIKNSKLSLRMKGINGVQVYNNTFYTNQGSGSIVLIDANHDRAVPASSTGAKIKNNIFYTVYQIPNISIESGCLTNFESDYNVFWCESGTPVFSVDGVSKTFSQWQAMGFDQHSVVVNPGFNNTTSFIPSSRLNYGTNLGTAWQTGLSPSAGWTTGSAPSTTNQNETWQVGAIIYAEPAPPVTPPPDPVYVSSSIENATPSVLEMNYNLALASIIPAASAFTITVNSSARNVNSVTISGSKVLLAMASPVVYGDAITVSYTRPSSNPLQTPAGGFVQTIGAQTVTNRVNAVTQPPVVTPNSPPVAVVKSQSSSIAGFVDEIDASGSYDPNNDNITFTWTVPSDFSVSSVNGSKIQFLSPVVSSPKKVEFVLTLSDGKTTQSKTVPLEIIPYKPDLEIAGIKNIEASSYQPPYYPYNILDGNIGTLWAAEGDNQWLVLELKEPFNIQHLKIAFQPGHKKESYFDILGSNDKVTWDPVLTKTASCGFSGDLQVFKFPESKAAQGYKYVKLVGHSNSADSWNYISEFRIFGYRYIEYYDLPVKLYPNPAHEFVNIHIDEMSLKPDFIRILNLAGKIMYQDKMDPDIKEIQIPLNLKQGIYIVQIGSGDLTLFTQKLVVNI
ncbi:MAG: discoidin domain-containing protein [Bacteroidota bacterium]|nr:discoidin domain-containing protein [Bacteroidota bacterium]